MVVNRDGMAAQCEAARNPRTDPPRAAGDENPHQ
jgi:hypothetical protein